MSILIQHISNVICVIRSRLAKLLAWKRQHDLNLLWEQSSRRIHEPSRSLKGRGSNATGVVCDVGRYTEVAQAVDRCHEAFGGLDILVNNAGVIEPIAHLADSDPEQWGRVADVNYKGVYHGLRAAIPVMLAQGSGVIVNISSGAATGALEGWSHYCSSKAAALSLTRCADKEYRAHGIRVLGLSPGTVATDMQIAINESGINPVSQLDPSVHISAVLASRAVAWLCTAAAAKFAGTGLSLRDEDVRRKVGLIADA